MTPAQHYLRSEELVAKAEEYLDQSDAPHLSDEDRTSLLMKAFYANAIANTHRHLAELATTSRSIAAEQAVQAATE